MKKKLSLIIAIGVFLFIQPIWAQTWNPSKRLTWNSEDSEFPVIVVDTNDHIHVVWQDESPGNLEIFYKKSTNGGTTWTTKRLTYNSGWSDRPAIATDSNNHIHVVWSNDWEICYKKSTDGGVTWITKRLTYNWGVSSDPAIAVDTNNHIHVVWDDSSSSYVPQIYYKKSMDGGKTWITKRLTYSAGWSEQSDIVVDSNARIHIVYQDDTTEIYYPEIYYKKSTDGGTSWTTKRLTYNSGWSESPAIATDSNNHIHVAWEDYIAGESYPIFYKRSTDGGVTWATKRITATWDSGFDPDIALDSNNYVHVVWDLLDIYYKKSTDGGATWVFAKKRLTWASGWSEYATVAVDSDNNIHVVWMCDTPGNYEIYYRKGIQ